MNEKFFNIGQTVYCINAWGTIDECIILDYDDRVSTPYYKLQIINGGWYTQIVKNIFNSYGEAIREKMKRSKEIKEKYKSKINNLKDLFDFMLSNMSGHETSDCEAICAAKERIKELTGIDLDKED